MVDKLRRPSLRWFKHVKRKCIYTPNIRYMRLVVIGFKRGRMKKNWGGDAGD